MKNMRIIDFHSHILPGADHGSCNLSMSESQLERLVYAGVDAVVATPHFSPNRDLLSDFIIKRERAKKELSSILTDSLPTVYTGAEVLVCPGMKNFEDLSELCVQGTKTILLEMPTVSWTGSIISSVEDIADAGYSVVLAHVERYNKALIDPLLKMGFNAQINTLSCKNIFSRLRVENYIRRGYVCAIGSDLHRDGSCFHFKKFTRTRPQATENIMQKTEELLVGAESLN